MVSLFIPGHACIPACRTYEHNTRWSAAVSRSSYPPVRYDKGDVQAIVKSHLQEKRELNEAVSVLKKVLIRSGAASDAELDLELSHVLDR